MSTPPTASRAIMRYGAAPAPESTRAEVMPGPALTYAPENGEKARARLEGLSAALLTLRHDLADAVHRATLDAMAGEVLAVRALLAPVAVTGGA